ncbi:MAG: HipA family kinase [Bacteroidota bacterium]
MKQLNSALPAHKVYPTLGSHPIEIVAEDMETYICKYSLKPAYGLLREYLGYQFAKLWGLYVPSAAFIQVARDHVPLTQLPDRIGYVEFEIPTFGVKKHPSAEEVGLTFSQKSDYEVRQIDKEEFLKIALFDLWLANEDRHTGNYNLMLAAPDSFNKSTFFRFMPIDHWLTFNSGDMEKGIYLLSENESLLNSPVRQRLFRSKAKLVETTRRLIAHFPGWVHLCQAQVSPLLGNIPPTWGIELPYIKSYLSDNIFRLSWVEEVKTGFTQRTQTLIN